MLLTSGLGHLRSHQGHLSYALRYTLPDLEEVHPGKSIPFISHHPHYEIWEYCKSTTKVQA